MHTVTYLKCNDYVSDPMSVALNGVWISPCLSVCILRNHGTH